MKLIESKAELLPWISGIEGIYKMIELAGRTCYKSTDKITDYSAKPFVDRMIASKHTAMLEHGTVYLQMSSDCNDENYWILVHSPYAKTVYDEATDMNYVTTNLRALIELFPTTWHGFLNTYVCNPTKFHEKRYTFKLTTSIGVTRELNRHRVNSIAEQSTRYCNYSKDKFGNEIKFIQPVWVNNEDVYNCFAGKTCPKEVESFLNTLCNLEQRYMYLVDPERGNWPPQQAREILPLCTATEIVHTAFASDWRHFFDLRLFGKTGKPHPNMLHLAELMKVEAEKQDIWEDIMKYPSKFK